MRRGLAESFCCYFITFMCDLFRFINHHRRRRRHLLFHLFFHLLLCVTICLILLIQRI